MSGKVCFDQRNYDVCKGAVRTVMYMTEVIKVFKMPIKLLEMLGEQMVHAYFKFVFLLVEHFREFILNLKVSLKDSVSYEQKCSNQTAGQVCS